MTMRPTVGPDGCVRLPATTRPTRPPVAPRACGGPSSGLAGTVVNAETDGAGLAYALAAYCFWPTCLCGSRPDQGWTVVTLGSGIIRVCDACDRAPQRGPGQADGEFVQLNAAPDRSGPACVTPVVDYPPATPIRRIVHIAELLLF